MTVVLEYTKGLKIKPHMLISLERVSYAGPGLASTTWHMFDTPKPYQAGAYNI